jgi:hypothetical protein
MLIALIACSTPQDTAELTPVGRVTGQVLDVTGAPVANAEIEVDGIVVEADIDGNFTVDGVSPGDHLVSFEADGYADGFKRTTLISWETVMINATLADIGGSVRFDAAEGGLFVVDGVAIDLSNITRTDGTAYTGEATMSVTYLDPYSTDMKYAPGDLSAVRYDSSDAKSPSAPAQLISNGMFNVEITTAEGEELDADMVVEMPISNGGLPEAYALGEGDSVPLWDYDAAKGIWVESGAGSVSWSETANALVFTYAVGGAGGGWKNCDQPVQWTCSSGVVRDVLGFPVRGALVNAAGGFTSAQTYTDEDGFYSVRVAIGDNVAFSAYTAVGGKQWSTSWGEYIAGEGDCSSETPHDIPVCREAGIVMADNLDLHIDGIDAGDAGDQLRAWFWEPPGDTWRCDDFWLDIPMDTCVTANPEDYPETFKPRTVGIAHETRSAGPWLDIKTPRDSYRMDADTIDGQPVYLWQTLDLQEGRLVHSPVDLESGDHLYGSTPGNAQAYFGPIHNQPWMTIPQGIELNSIWGAMGTHSRANGMTMTFEAGSSDYLLAFVTNDSNTDGLMCRIADDGSLNIPAADLTNLPSGHASVSIYRPQIDWAEGPDGLPIRLQALSGQIVGVELK